MEELDGFHSVRRFFLDVCNGGNESCFCVNDSVGGCYFRKQEAMMIELKRVSDPLTSCVGHEYPNAPIEICCM